MIRERGPSSLRSSQSSINSATEGGLHPVPVPASVWWREFRTRALLPLLTLGCLFVVGQLWRKIILDGPPPSALADAQRAREGYLVGLNVDTHHTRKKNPPTGVTNVPFPSTLAMTNTPTKVVQ